MSQEWARPPLPSAAELAMQKTDHLVKEKPVPNSEFKTAFTKTTFFKVGDYVITTYGEYSQYGIGRLLRCIKDCEIKEGKVEDSDCFEVIPYWELHEDDNDASHYESGMPNPSGAWLDTWRETMTEDEVIQNAFGEAQALTGGRKVQIDMPAYYEAFNAEKSKPILCDNCKWFDSINPRQSETRDERRGKCRRRAPNLAGISYAEWPFVKALDWCGDYTPS